MHVFLAILFSAVLCKAQTGEVPSLYWKYPPAFGTIGFYVDDIVVQLNQTMQLQWTTDKANYTIWLFHQLQNQEPTLGAPIYGADPAVLETSFMFG